ncbi:hypothetical protein Taro_045061 [Colocasia esculenta]|uniref:DYW domain-containing protein n=1 Tax=Colocasia esculenta TaxID=4460 RepID=A0A843WW38_COLES|nr:hypothetical protein [Colocasia esculenta]
MALAAPLSTTSVLPSSRLHPFIGGRNWQHGGCLLPASSRRSQLEPASSGARSRSCRASALVCLEERKFDASAEVAGLCEVGDLRSAVGCISGAHFRGFQLDAAAYCSVLQLCADLGSLEEGRKVHAMLCSSGFPINGVVGSKLVFMYVRCGDLGEGRRVFDGFASKTNNFTWNLLLNEYTKMGNYSESILLFNRMRESGVNANSHTLSCVLKCVGALGRVQGGEQVHGYILKLGFDSYVAVGNALIALYCKCRQIHSAFEVFDGMPERDVISWNSMISGCAANGLPIKCIELLEEMWCSGISMDLATLVSIFPACAESGALSQGMVLHGFATKSGLIKEMTLNNVLLDFYSKCGNLGHAVKVFEKMSHRSVVTWTSMISGHTRAGQFEEAIRLFREMESEGVAPDLFVITSVLHACACNESLEEGKRVHEYVTRRKLEKNLFVANALMDMYAKCGCMTAAKMIFEHMVVKDTVSWNTMIGGYSKNCLPNEALTLFSEMQSQIRPNSVTIACVLPALASLSFLDRGREMHAHVLRMGWYCDGYVANGLVDMYVKCGALKLARQLFDRILVKDLVSWTVMIAGYGMHGHGRDAIAVFKEMQRSAIEPDGVSFIAILYACSHSGLVEEGWRFFNTMRYEYKIEPQLEHYACMVDLLGRAGHLIEAYEFIQSMPIEPDSTVWGALLFACRIHRDVKLAEEAADKVFALEPENTGYYVLLANIYAEAEKWEAVKKLRERIGSNRLRKKPGCSWIEVKSKVHIFVAGDKAHPQTKQVELLLENVMKKMKEEGYAPKLRYALLRADDMEKEEALCGHSEKLAIAFGMLNSPRGKPIRVAKNLRVCGDCHEVAKFMSKALGREIILRDSNRFHHFEDGRCSCRGYW